MDEWIRHINKSCIPSIGIKIATVGKFTLILLPNIEYKIVGCVDAMSLTDFDDIEELLRQSHDWHKYHKLM